MKIFRRSRLRRRRRPLVRLALFVAIVFALPTVLIISGQPKDEDRINSVINQRDVLEDPVIDFREVSAKDSEAEEPSEQNPEPDPEPEEPEQTPEQAAKTGEIIYLTFDDGPSPYTANLLDILKKYGIKATFFVTGAGDESLITREYNEGHAIGLHTMTHRYDLVYSSPEAFFAELDAVQARVKNATGKTTNLVRFPGGSSNTISRRYDHGTHIMSYLAQETTNRGLVYFDWNVDSNDAGTAKTAGEVYTNVVTTLKPGESVVLQHDNRDFSVAAVESIIQYGLEHGYTFAKLDAGSFTAHHGVAN